MSSLFSRVTKYRPGTLVDPSENRLTESLAAVLTGTPGLTTSVVEWLTDSRPRGEPRVQTQRLTASGGFIDLELRFGPLTRPTHLVWIEVKHGAIATLDQLLRYEADILSEGATQTALVLLIPASAEAPSGVAAGVHVARWQNLHRRLQLWLHRHSRELAAENRWLVGQFIKFLEEERVADPGAMTSLDVVAATGATRAFQLLDAVREGAEALIEQQWTRTAGQDRRYGRFFRHYRPAAVNEEAWLSRWPVGWFEWRLSSDRNLATPTGGLVFGAGYTRNKRQIPSGEAQLSWVADRERQDFEVVLDDQWRLYRHLRLDSTVTETTEAQARLIAEWVMVSFDTLESSPIP